MLIYRAAVSAPLVTSASGSPFFGLFGSAETRLLRVRRILVTLPTLGTAAFKQINLVKYRTQPTGGDQVALLKVPIDSQSPASESALCVVFQSAPTAGHQVGVIAARRVIYIDPSVAPSDTVDGADFDFRDFGGIVLRTNLEGVCLQHSEATGATTITIDAEWSEE